MNKYEVLGIVGEGELSLILACYYMYGNDIKIGL